MGSRTRTLSGANPLPYVGANPLPKVSLSGANPLPSLRDLRERR